MKAIIILFGLCCIHNANSQTTVFLFNSGTTATIDNALGTPTFSTNVTANNVFASGCTGNNVYGNVFMWGVGSYLQFQVNTKGCKNMVFSYNELTSDHNHIGTFIVRVSLNGISNWTTIRSDYLPPETSCGSSGNLNIPSTFDDTTSMYIQIYKSGDGDGNRSFRIDDVLLTSHVKLPIQLSSFDIIEDRNPKLKWTTLSENNNDYFTIERSTDGSAFTKIAQIKGNGTTDAKHDYTYIDQHPFDGMNFYKLTQVDLDGSNTSYPIKSAFIPIHDLKIFPTIFTDRLKVLIPKSENHTQWIITNIVGQPIAQGAIMQGIVYDEINIASLPSGAYIVILRQGSRQVTHKVVKM